MNKGQQQKVIQLSTSLPFMPEGYTGQGSVLAKNGLDVTPILRAIENHQILSARVTSIDAETDTIMVYLGDEYGGLFGVMSSAEFDAKKYAGYQGFVGDLVDVLLLEYLPKSSVVRVSRRQAREIKAKATLGVLKPGMVVKGVVKSITAYGMFLDIGGLHGMLSVDEISHDFVAHPSDTGLQRNDAVDVKVLSIDQDEHGQARVRVSLKALTNPWVTIPARIKPQQVMLGKVVSVVGPHVYVKAEPSVGVDILCPTNDKAYEIGRYVRIQVVRVDTEARKLRGRIIGIVRGA